MNAAAMEPLGRALLAFQRGDMSAELVIRREDGLETPLPVSSFFRGEAEFSPIEGEAIRRCQGRVLDVGAGAGLHSLVLQRMRVPVTAIDISPQAVEVLGMRGVKDARCVDVLEFVDGPFETLLVLGHGIGMVEDLEGLDTFLDHVRGLVSKGGKILLDSTDVRITGDPAHHQYHETTRRAGRYVGETRIQVEFDHWKSPYFGWLHVDGSTLEERARKTGWRCEILVHVEDGSYLAGLRRLTL